MMSVSHLLLLFSIYHTGNVKSMAKSIMVLLEFQLGIRSVMESCSSHHMQIPMMLIGQSGNVTTWSDDHDYSQ